MPPDPPNPYDEVPYPGLTHFSTHVDRLATIGHLAGMPVARPDSCRVLEVGCGDGRNLVTMAASLPGSDFLGIDYGARHVAAARALAAALGLGNVRFEERDLLDFGAEDGEFDYVVAHGVYSWVPEPVREGLLSVCSRNLAANGVAYVSYNTYPGWHALQAVREMMLYHARDATDSLSGVRTGLALAEFLAEAMPPDSNELAFFLSVYRRMVEERSSADPVLLLHGVRHDELADVNQPAYFHEFAAAAARHGLRYLAEADTPKLLRRQFSERVEAALHLGARDLVEVEQYLDFLANRRFRASLLVHREAATRSVAAETDPAWFEPVHVASGAQPAAPSTAEADQGAARFETSAGAHFATNHPVTRAAFDLLAAAAPASLPFPVLFEKALSTVHGTAGPVPKDRERDGTVLATGLLRAFGEGAGLLYLHLVPPPVAATVSERPLAAPVARLLASRGERVVPNARHDRVTLDPETFLLLPLLDGTRDQAALRRALASAAKPAGGNGAGEDQRQHVGEGMEGALDWLCRSALLVD